MQTFFIETLHAPSIFPFSLVLSPFCEEKTERQEEAREDVFLPGNNPFQRMNVLD